MGIQIYLPARSELPLKLNEKKSSNHILSSNGNEISQDSLVGIQFFAAFLSAAQAGPRVLL